MIVAGTRARRFDAVGEAHVQISVGKDKEKIKVWSASGFPISNFVKKRNWSFMEGGTARGRSSWKESDCILLESCEMISPTWLTTTRDELTENHFTNWEIRNERLCGWMEGVRLSDEAS